MASPKLQRWIDLLAALLPGTVPITFEELKRRVPAYHASGEGKEATLRRMFERDKDELRAAGIPIETVLLPDGETQGYRLRTQDFYLPYLSLRADGRKTSPAKVSRYGYRALADLTFDADGLYAIRDAAARITQLGDPVLAGHAESAIRKLAFDLPLDSAAMEPSRVASSSDRVSDAVFEVLDEALASRKRVTFRYRSMHADDERTREAHPYGLFFLSQHWYLAAAAPDDPRVKNYRLSRISAPKLNTERPGTPDFTRPRDFDLRAHARSRQAWELGEGDGEHATVEFRGESGAAVAARKLGDAVEGHPKRRRFLVRRRDAFARWLLSFAGEIVPVAPAEVVAEFRALAAATRARYLP
jgi:proteasome accessory factor B